MKRRMSVPKVQLTQFHFQKQSFDRFSLRDAKGTILPLSELIKGSPSILVKLTCLRGGDILALYHAS